MYANHNTVAAEIMGDFFKSIGKKGPLYQKKMVKHISENPGRPLALGAIFGSELSPKNPRAAISTLPDVTAFHHTAEGLYVRKWYNFINSVYAKEMTTPTLKLQPSAPLEKKTKNDLEQKLE